MLAMTVATLCFTACGGDDDGDNGNGGTNFNQVYDELRINGVKYACYGYRSAITYSSSWDSSIHCGEIVLPCGKISDAQEGKYNYDYMYTIFLEGNQNLNIGSKLENYSPKIEDLSKMNSLFNYVSGSATIIDKKDDKYITVRFDDFTFKNYTLNGTVQLLFEENSDLAHN